MHGNVRFLLTSLLVALLSSLVFLPGLPGDFVFDDTPNIVNNESIRLTELTAGALGEVVATPQVSGQMRGLPTLTFALDYWRGGGADPATFKTTNIAIHALTVFALAWLFHTLLLLAAVKREWVRWLAPALTLAWAVHPLQVSSVLYAVQRLQTMGTLFLVLALLAYLAARQRQIEGLSGRTALLGTLLLWALAMGCKEDSVLLPAYTLALELTLLRFAAADVNVARRMRQTYLITALIGAFLYLVVFIPNHWSWDAYGGRDFSTAERLLTQARVLVMYLWQIVLPMPSHMPFYYDGLQPSRGLLQPGTTLPSILLIAGLLVMAWRLRHRSPLLALGILLFFSAHFITSNVVGLELAFEHRNHFALIGAVLAIGALLAEASQRLRLRLRLYAQIATVALLLVALAATTMVRGHSWNSKLSLALTNTSHAPNSARAWVELCSTYFTLGGGAVKTNTQLDPAIAACTSGARLAPYALNNAALLIVLKTLRGDVSQRDWDLFQRYLETVNMSWDNQRAPLILTHHQTIGVKLDKAPLLKALATLERRASLNAYNLASLGNFVMDELGEPDLAMPYFLGAIEKIAADDPYPVQLGAELRQKGRPDLAERIERLGPSRHFAP